MLIDPLYSMKELLRQVERLNDERAWLEYPTEFKMVFHNDGTTEVTSPEYQPSPELLEGYKFAHELRERIHKEERELCRRGLMGKQLICNEPYAGSNPVAGSCGL